mmetsp:Transcript_26270/g.59258  ORF Transcript_26270/g.59258 Transcript_26270/m.59258 type:complete len:218 (-) Transcript_26270:906-1559(-)
MSVSGHARQGLGSTAEGSLKEAFTPDAPVEFADVGHLLTAEGKPKQLRILQDVVGIPTFRNHAVTALQAPAQGHLRSCRIMALGDAVEQWELRNLHERSHLSGIRLGQDLQEGLHFVRSSQRRVGHHLDIHTPAEVRHLFVGVQRMDLHSQDCRRNLHAGQELSKDLHANLRSEEVEVRDPKVSGPPLAQNLLEEGPGLKGLLGRAVGSEEIHEIDP